MTKPRSICAGTLLARSAEVMRILVSLVWALALVLYPACGGRKTPDLQPAAATPEPMGPGDPEPMPVPDLTPPVDAAPSETTP